MRRNRKLLALCLIAVMMVSLLSACAGRTYNDAKYTGELVNINRLYEDATDQKIVSNNTIYIEGEVIETPGTNTETPGTNTETPGTNTETPGTNTETPGTNTETPGTNTETPGTNTETPGTNEEPGTNTETPGTNEEPGDDDYVDYNTTCMSFNVLQWDTHYSGYATPDVRAPWIVDTINIYDPDLLGTQEVTKVTAQTNNFDMYEYLVEKLSPKYDYRSLIDETGKAGSKVAVTNLTIGSGLVIFWKKDRFELKDSGAMVYSNDPGRHFQWVKLYDKQEDITIVMTNTHMSINPGTDSAAGDNLRLGQANELYNFWERNCEEGMALYGTGDYNHNTSAPAFQSLNKGRFVSSRDVSGKSNANSSIDFVYINGDVQACFQYIRCNETYEPEGVPKGDVDKRNLQYCPSDHYAVVARCTNEYLS